MLIGSKEVLNIKLITDIVDVFDFSVFKGKPVIIKGCSDQKLPLSSIFCIIRKITVRC